ncbi:MULTISPECIES: aminoacyl-tRNA hydrolase [Laceyella]|jgi:peptidyl-tRNA hydrolase, PTH1 family|uniref:Peptidyl-tRNA hydrolase n=1 Tax=Laceyella sediminis TaxID=573074 RepID=A0ABX5EQM4_9BACL|nr:aminoacyl-tRNA hydrolase [Laceyella sediminis]MRG27021.1 aminoacyl-tRNA hydrolase [Laceyella tengchongensis]PRZ13226.1 peptidyl-tRNA hydrolase [Laceyella sediminis]
MKLIVGLGNPGIKYAQTRHNIGFWVIDRLSDEWGIPVNKEKWKAEVGEGVVRGEKVILMKPLTYMNLSGEAVRPAMDWLKADLDELVVVYDDLDLPPGQIRLRLKGSSGGHNGMKSLIQHLGTDQFKRIKIGIGRPQGRMPVPDYVLSPFHKSELELMADAVERSASAINCWLDKTFLEAMNRYNIKPGE